MADRHEGGVMKTVDALMGPFDRLEMGGVSRAHRCT